MKKKILQIITLPDCGGAQTHLIEIVTGFKDEYELAVAVGKEGFLTDELKKYGIPFYIIPSLIRSISPIQDLKATVELSSLIKKIQPALIHCHSSKAGIIGRIAGLINKVPSIYTAHGWAFHPKVKFIQRTIALISEIFCSFLSKKIICVSEYDCQLALSTNWFAKNKLITIHNGIRDLPPESKNFTNLNPKVLMVCRFAEPKRPELLIKAFSQIKNSNAKLWLIGEGPQLPAAKELVENLQLGNQVEFLGELYSLESYYREATVFCLISDREGLPISVIEALRARLPIIASKVGGLPELISENENGFLIEENNAVANLTEKLELVLSDAKLQEKFSSKSRQIFEENFTKEAMIFKLQKLYQSILN